VVRELEFGITAQKVGVAWMGADRWRWVGRCGGGEEGSGEEWNGEVWSGGEERRAVEWIGLQDKPKPARGIDEGEKDETFEV
jgi:hypothetical protein